jgi:hypothetical protein
VASAGTPPGPQILTTDASRFYAIYDSTGGKPSVAQLAGYLAEGSPGLGELAKARRVTPERMAEAIASQPGVYAQGRSCLAELPAVKQRLVQVFGNLQAIYPQAAFPPVTLAVGRGRPVGLTSKSGVIIGLEALCAADFMNPNVQDRFVHVIAHEYVHIQQTGLNDFEPGDPHATVLRVSLGEGISATVAMRRGRAAARSTLKAPLRWMWTVPICRRGCTTTSPVRRSPMTSGTGWATASPRPITCRPRTSAMQCVR